MARPKLHHHRSVDLLRKHILHALCGHDGERWIVGAPVDGYDPTTNTVFQYHGCYWHGCLRCFPKSRGQIIKRGRTRENRYLATEASTRALREAGYRFIEKWECNDQETQYPLSQQETKTYPHPIFYDFESYQDKSGGTPPTFSLMKTRMWDFGEPR